MNINEFGLHWKHLVEENVSNLDMLDIYNFSLEGDILNDDDFRFLCLDNEGISYDEFKFEEKKEITTLSLPLDVEITKKIKLKTIGGGRLNIKYNANYHSDIYNISSVDAVIKVKYKSGVVFTLQN